jgi:hypothetical protein
MTYGFFTWKERSREKATLTVNLPDILPDGTNYPAIVTAMDTLQTALEAVTQGVIMERTIVAERTRLTNIVPGDGRREQKLSVAYQDDVTKGVYTTEIPVYDTDALPYANGTDFIDLNYTVAGTKKDNLDMLLAALNGSLRSPLGNPVTVIQMQDIGKNN